MRIYSQKLNEPKRDASSFRPSRITPHAIGNQAVPGAAHASAEGLKGSASSSATTGFGHDFSRIPVFSKSQLGLQAKLTVNTPGDIYEQEADRVAEQVTSMPEPQLQRTCACGGGCAKCRNEHTPDERMQTKRVPANHSGAISAPPIVHEVLHSPGQPLDTTTQGFMEPRFGHDFSRVRVHTDARAAESAHAVNALAYTVGHNIVFGAERFAPYTSEGKKLLAHELTHVLQNNEGAVQRQAAGLYPPASVVHWSEADKKKPCAGPANEGSGARNVFRGGYGVVDNETKHTFAACASPTKGDNKEPTQLGPGKWGIFNTPPLGPTGHELKDIDFVFPSSEAPINGQTVGMFKIGSNKATLSPDPANSKCSKFDNFLWYKAQSGDQKTCDFYE